MGLTDKRYLELDIWPKTSGQTKNRKEKIRQI